MRAATAVGAPVDCYGATVDRFGAPVAPAALSA